MLSSHCIRASVRLVIPWAPVFVLLPPQVMFEASPPPAWMRRWRTRWKRRFLLALLPAILAFDSIRAAFLFSAGILPLRSTNAETAFSSQESGRHSRSILPCCFCFLLFFLFTMSFFIPFSLSLFFFLCGFAKLFVLLVSFLLCLLNKVYSYVS